MSTAIIKYYLPALLMAIVVTSCTKVIDLKLGNNTGQLVIEGNIVNRPGRQIIKLSENVPFTSANVYPAVSGAVVTVNDALGNAFQFTEGPAGTYTASGLSGVPGSTYAMTVKTNGKTYTASSKMPLVVLLDSLTTSSDAFNSSKNRKRISVHYQDPPGVPNQYRFTLTVNRVQVPRTFAFNDDFDDGRYVNLTLFENDVDILPGDTVKVEMQCVDKPIYTYWFTLMQQGNGPGGGVTPSNPPTNITPATLGYFSAHTTQSLTIVVK